MKRLLSLASVLLVALLPANAEEVRIHLGYTESSQGDASEDTGVKWNQIRTWGPVQNSDLLTIHGAPSPITWETTERFSFHFSTGLEESELEYPGTVSRHGFFLARKEKIGEQGPFSSAEVVLRGLDPDKLYALTFYGSRMVGYHGDVSLHITARGSREEQAALHLIAGGNMEAEESIRGVRPDDDGSLTLKFEVLEGYNRGTINSITIREQETQ